LDLHLLNKIRCWKEEEEEVQEKPKILFNKRSFRYRYNNDSFYADEKHDLYNVSPKISPISQKISNCLYLYLDKIIYTFTRKFTSKKFFGLFLIVSSTNWYDYNWI
jgi:hypothetical protein